MVLFLEGRPKEDLLEYGVEGVKRLAEHKGFEVPHFEMSVMDGLGSEWLARELVWIVQNHPDHPRV